MSSESECVKEEAAWEAECMETLWAALYADHEIKPDLVLGPETIQAPDIALPVARGHVAYASNVQPKNEATQDLEDVSATHSNHEDGVSIMHNTEATRNPRDFSTSFEDASVSNTTKQKATQEAGFVSIIHTSIPDVSDTNILNTEAMQNSSDISTSLEDASASNTLKTAEKQEARVISTTQASLQGTSVNEPIPKNIKLSLKPCYIKLERTAYKSAFICQICQKICKTKHILMIHIVCHTQDEINTIKIAKKVTKNGKFNCDICGKGLQLRHNLVNHIKNHAKDPFKEQLRLKTPKDSITKIYYTCDICGMSTLRKNNLIKHMKRHATEEPFACEVCKKQFRVAWELVDHIKLASCEPLNGTLMVDPPSNTSILQDLVLKSCYVSLERIEIENKCITVKINNKTVDIYSESKDSFDEDQQPKKLSCNICSKRFKCDAELVTHASSHTGEKHFTCDVCKNQYQCKQALQTHIQMLHLGVNCHSCKFCKERFCSAFSLRKHVQNHTAETRKKPHACKVGKKKFTNEKECVEHVRLHTGEKPFLCTVCNMKFRLEVALRIHSRIHTGPPYCCDVCKRSFSSWKRLDCHKCVPSDEKFFTCDICKKEFKRFDILVTHKRTHTGERPFACEICQKRFTHSSHLSSHRKTHTGEKPFRCTVCNKKFSDMSKLNVHNRVHTGERPYSCDICKKAFAVSGTLKIHIRSHTGEKPYKCKVCKMQFAQGSNLRTHMRSHGKKTWPFTCHVCEKKFQRRLYLDGHMALHDRYTPYVCDVCGARFKSRRMLSVHAHGHYGGEVV